jgi:hypothetical protein
MGPYFLDPPAPHDAAVGLTDLHCEDQEQPGHAYQIANLVHALPPSEPCREANARYSPLRKRRFRHEDGGLHVKDSHNRTGVAVLYGDRHHSVSRGIATIVEFQEPLLCRRIAHKLPDSGIWNSGNPQVFDSGFSS